MNPGSSQVVVRTSQDGDYLFSIQKREKFMYFVWLGSAIAAGVILAKTAKSFGL